MKFQLLACLCFIGSVLVAQDLQRAVVASGGGSFLLETAERNYYVSQTIGQSGVIGTIGQDGLRLRQGFQQPPLMVVQAPDDETSLQARLYPNPVRYQLNISLANNLKGQLAVKLFDTSGKLVLDASYPAGQPISMDLSELSSGVYLISLQHQTNSFTSRIIKN